MTGQAGITSSDASHSSATTSSNAISIPASASATALLHAGQPPRRGYGTTEANHEVKEDGEDSPLLARAQDEDDNGETDPEEARSLDEAARESDEVEPTQAGVQKIEAMARTWSNWSLWFAYAGIYMMAFSTSLESQTVQALSPYATSSFKKHSLISTVLVVQNVVQAVIKPPMAKVADAFGRLEAFCFAIVLFVAGYIQMAASQNVQTYAAAQIFYSSGATGLQILQQIFIADTSSLINRALFSTLPDLPFLATVWLGPVIAQWILDHTNWRWGYGIWTIILPLAFLPLALALVLNQRRAYKLGLVPPSAWKRLSFLSWVKTLWFELDLGGLILLSGAISLVLIPLTLTTTTHGGWGNPKIITMIVFGLVGLPIYVLWDTNKWLAPKPVLSLRLFKQRTTLAGCVMAFFYFMAFFFSVQPYFYSYLQVVQGRSIVVAGRITQIFSFTSTITSIVVSFVIMYTKRYRTIIALGSIIYIIGLALMTHYRKQGSSVAQLVGTQVFLGVGGSMIHVPAQVGVQASVSHQDVAAVTAIFLTFLEMGGAVGSAVSGAWWSSSIPSRLARYLPVEHQGEAQEIFGSLTKALSYPMGSPVRDAINQAYQETMDVLLILAFCVALPLLFLTFMMEDYELDKMDDRERKKKRQSLLTLNERPNE